MALNVNSVDVNFFRVKPESLGAFVSQWEYRNSLSNWESDNLLKMAELVYTGRFDLNPERNTREAATATERYQAVAASRHLHCGDESGRTL